MAQLKYIKVKDYLLKLASQPESANNLPSVRALMKKFNVSLATVNKALSILENDGIIQRKQGQGIMSVTAPRAVTVLEKEKGQKTIVLAYVDYPTKQIWDMTYCVWHFAMQDKIRIIEFKLHQHTKLQALIDFVAETPDCQGLLMNVGAVKISDAELKGFGELDIPVAIVDSMYFYKTLSDNIRIFSPDPTYSARVMAKHLYNKGHRKIGYIRNEPHGDYSEQFQKNLLSFLAEYGTDFSKDNIYASAIRSWEDSLSAAYSQTLNNIEEIKAKGYTALIYKSSPGAVAGIKVLCEHGIRIPQEISIISEGDDQLYQYLWPGLTTVTADYQAMYKSAVDYLCGILTPQNPHTLFPLILTERESVLDLSKKN